jgi:autotransporter-associated beta strand protein
MNTPIRAVAPLLGSIALLLVPSYAAEIQKADNTSALNTTISWVGGVVPGAGDIALFNNVLTLANTSPLGASLTLDGIRVTNPTGSVIMASTAGAQLTLGASGVNMSTASAALMFEGALQISADQTWNIANASTAGSPFAGANRQLNNNEDFAINGGNTTGAGILFDLGGHTVTTTGAGTISISSGYTLSGGTFNIGNFRFEIQGGANKLTNVNSDVVFNIASGSILHYQSNSGAFSSAAVVNLNGGTLQFTSNNATNAVTQSGVVNVNQPSTILVANNVGGGGNLSPLVLSGNLVGSAPLAINATANNAGAILRLTGDNTAYTGTITFGGTAGRSTRLASFAAGSAAATWNVSAGHTLQIDGVTVDLGTLAGAGTVTSFNAGTSASINVGSGNFAGAITDGTTQISLNKVSNGTLTLSGANTYAGTTSVLAGSLFATPGSLGATPVSVGDGAIFGPKLVTAGTTLFVSSVTTGNVTGAQLLFDFGTMGNPTMQAMNAGVFTVNAPTSLRIAGTGLTIGSFPLLGYTGTIGGLSFGGLSLVLPPRMTGSLVNDSVNSQVSVNITHGFDVPKWTGAIDGKWDIDNGTGTGTANWREINSGIVTRYIQNVNGSDSVRFDDTATGTTTVELTAELSPDSITVDNTTKEYAFTGTGRITGGRGLTKSGTGTLRIRNTGNNDYSGGTIINAGTIELGDGITVGVGTLGTGAITNNGLLVFNRQDAFTFANIITGNGGLSLSGSGTATLTGSVTQAGPVTLTAGSVVFGGGGNLSGAITGAGSVTVSGGTMTFSGVDANLYTGATTVSGGTLQLNKSPGVSAVPGNVTISGGGVLAILGNEQIPDTATINVTGTSPDSTAGTTGTETVANVNMNASVPTGQFIMRNNFTVTGQATVQNGIFGVASAHTANVNAIVMSGGIVRISGNSAASTLNVGVGGITASAGEIQVKFNTNNQDATLNLGGDFTATGNIAITNAGYAGPNVSQIVLTGPRTFNIAAGTTTTVAPDVTGPGGLTKTGNGTLDLRGRALSYAGDTIVSAGTLRVPAVAGFATPTITIADNATLGVRIPVAGNFIPTTTLTLGSAAGGTISFDLDALGNPIAAPIVPTNFTVSTGSKLVIVGATTPGTFSLIDYTGAIGGAGFAGLTLQLPLRVAGNLVNNSVNTSVDVTILGTDTPKWNGNINTNWDIDNGTGTGTANWRGSLSGAATRYLQGSAGTDQVIFDDTATGSGTVNLTTTLTPVAVSVNNAAKTYTFTGPGKLAGTGSLTKEGTGTLVLANSVPYENTGGTFVNAGTLQVGDGVTPGVGVLPNGTTTNNASLTLNRPDDFDLFSAIAGTGTLTKIGTNTASFTAALTYAGPVAISGGTMRFTAGGNLSGVLSGTGALLIDGGTLQLSGFEANTLSGETTVSSGTLQLNKGGANAIAGNLTLLNNGALTLSQAEQIADTATLIFNKTAGNQVIGNETIAAFNIIGGSETAQLQANNGFVVTGIATMSTGVFSVASNHSATVGGMDISGGTLRIAANSNPSTLNVGANGITASGGLIQVGQGVGAFDAVLNLGGNFAATGNVNVTDGNFGGAQKREINLGDSTRTFNVADLATLTVAPDIAGTGGLAKAGPGTLILTGASASTYTGATSVTAGVLEIVGSIAGTAKVDVSGTGTLSGSGTISPTAAGNVNILGGGKLSPGPFVAALTVNLLAGGELDLSLGVTPPNSQALVFDLDLPFLSDKILVNGGALRIGNGVLEFGDFAFTPQFSFDVAGTYTLFDGTSPILGTLGTAIDGIINGQIFELQFADSGNDLVLVPVPEPATALSVLAGLAILARRRRRK